MSESSIVQLNVGGTKFTTSKQTLLKYGNGNNFFTSLLSGRIPLLKDDDGAIFIDRDPDLFRVILNYLRTRTFNADEANKEALLHEAEFYGLQSLVKQLQLCNGLDEDGGCGSLLFYSYLAPPLNIPQHRLRNSVSASVDPLRVRMLRAHQNCIAVAYPHFVAVFKQKENNGFQPIFSSPYLDLPVEGVAINAKTAMVAASFGDKVRLMSFEGAKCDIGTFHVASKILHLFFIGSQLVALSSSRIGVWNSMTQHWQSQEVLDSPITSHDTAGSFLLLGSAAGSINYVDMQKFPLRMKVKKMSRRCCYRVFQS